MNRVQLHCLPLLPGPRERARKARSLPEPQAQRTAQRPRNCYQMLFQVFSPHEYCVRRYQIHSVCSNRPHGQTRPSEYGVTP